MVRKSRLAFLRKRDPFKDFASQVFQVYQEGRDAEEKEVGKKAFFHGHVDQSKENLSTFRRDGTGSCRAREIFEERFALKEIGAMEDEKGFGKESAGKGPSRVMSTVFSLQERARFLELEGEAAHPGILFRQRVETDLARLAKQIRNLFPRGEGKGNQIHKGHGNVEIHAFAAWSLTGIGTREARPEIEKGCTFRKVFSHRQGSSILH